MTLTLALSYGGRAIAHAARELARAVQAGRIRPADDVTPEALHAHMPSLTVGYSDSWSSAPAASVASRTSCSTAYAELHFADVLWPTSTPAICTPPSRATRGASAASGSCLPPRPSPRTEPRAPWRQSPVSPSTTVPEAKTASTRGFCGGTRWTWLRAIFLPGAGRAQKALCDPGVGIYAAVAQEGPVAARLLDQRAVDFAEHNLFSVVRPLPTTRPKGSARKLPPRSVEARP